MNTGILFSLIAGFSTLIGYLFTYYSPKKRDRVVVISLSFAFGIMTLISMKELLIPPLKVILKTPTFFNFFFLFLIPIFFIYSLLYLKRRKKGRDLYEIGLLNMITLLLHNLPEGIIVYLTTAADTSLGLKITLAILLHNIPEGLSIAIPIYYAKNSRKRAFLAVFVASIAEPLGAILTYLFLSKMITWMMIQWILYFVGIFMLSISFMEILPEILSYKHYNWILIGLFLASFILIL